jgi:putative acetyltransferase
MPEIRIRPEQPSDYETVFEVNRLAFETDVEAHLVAALRSVADPLISLVAERDGGVVGHILFSPVTVAHHENEIMTMGLGPMAVLPDFQRQEIGSQLVQAGLEACRALDVGAVFVLGHPNYYPRFGFQSAAEHDLHYQSADFDPYFMVMALQPGVLESLSGFVRYHPVFDTV